jgi:MerR family transcriptional regulator, light-induced transcriptional regulator
MLDTNPVEHQGIQWWPPPGSAKLDPSIPEGLSAAFREGMRCLGAPAPHAAAVMYRRTIEGIVRDKGSAKAFAQLENRDLPGPSRDGRRSLLDVPEKSARADNSAAMGAEPGFSRLSRTYLDALRANDAAGAYRVASRAFAEGVSPATLYQSVITPAMHELGRLWEKGAITIADERLATVLTHQVLGALRPPAFADQDFEADSTKPRAMLAAVQGEQHALGLRMAADLLEDLGFQTLYLGADVPTEALLQAVEELSPDLLGLSATMPGSTPRLEDTVARMSGAHPRLSVMVGGQASASPQLGEATPVDDLELLGECVRAF